MIKHCVFSVGGYEDKSAIKRLCCIQISLTSVLLHFKYRRVFSFYSADVMHICLQSRRSWRAAATREQFRRPRSGIFLAMRTPPPSRVSGPSRELLIRGFSLPSPHRSIRVSTFGRSLNQFWFVTFRFCPWKPTPGGHQMMEFELGLFFGNLLM